MDDEKVCSKCGDSWFDSPEFFVVRRGKTLNVCKCCESERRRAYNKRAKVISVASYTNHLYKNAYVLDILIELLI